jgi:hypothetical protein
MKVVFWVSLDPNVWFFLKNNPTLRDLATTYPLIAACSNGIEKRAEELIPDVNIVTCENYLLRKGKICIHKALSMNADVIARIDADLLILDLDWVVRLAREIDPKGKQLAGNIISKNKKGIIKSYVRGALNFTSKALAETMDLIALDPGKKTNDFDRPYAEEAQRVGAVLLEMKTFEIGTWYKGTAPAWHPPTGRLRRTMAPEGQGKIKKKDAFIMQKERLGIV